MKKWLLLILFLWMSWNASSQTILTNEEGDTLFCFSVEETRKLVKSIEKGRFCDSTVLFLERENGQLRLIIDNQKEVLMIKDGQVHNLEQVIENNRHATTLLKEALADERRLFKRQRRQKWLATGAGILLGVLALL